MERSIKLSFEDIKQVHFAVSEYWLAGLSEQSELPYQTFDHIQLRG